MEIVLVLTILIQVLAVINFLLFWVASSLYGELVENYANCGFDLLLVATIHTLFTFHIPKLILEIITVSFLIITAIELLRRNNCITIITLITLLVVLLLIGLTYQDAEPKQ